ncbi:repetitive organellar protein-like [Hypomesus transpacificus]|uniref:repetitive organellar protein-like n=1 Tax=Hypomesus transpacificus TaxID=137520 RepID=UPI001F083C2B|nr:repetitive organellar protein-like [Hypomesus transpacificus]
MSISRASPPATALGLDMNDLDNPQQMNIRPEQRGGGDGIKWNHALLVLLLGLAAYRWVWSSASRKELQMMKIQYEDKIMGVRAEYEVEIMGVRAEYEVEIMGVRAEYEDKIMGVQAEYEDNIMGVQAEYEDNIMGVRAEYEDEIMGVRAEYKDKIMGVQAEYEDEITGVRAEYEDNIMGVQAEYEDEITGVRAEYEDKIMGVRAEYEVEIMGVRAELEKKHLEDMVYRKAVVSQIQQLREENQRLTVQHALAVLDTVEESLLRRQAIFCILFSYDWQLDLEREIMDRVEREREALAGLDIKRGLNDIFKKDDRQCILPVLYSDLLRQYMEIWRKRVSQNKPGNN